MPKKILIIEDDPYILTMLQFIFLDEGYEVVLSENGMAAEHLDEILPDLILLDIRLKDRGPNGDEICSRLKSVQATRDFPVILVSAECDLKEISLACGADGFICKPFDVAELTGKVRQALNHVQLKE